MNQDPTHARPDFTFVVPRLNGLSPWDRGLSNLSAIDALCHQLDYISQQFTTFLEQATSSSAPDRILDKPLEDWVDWCKFYYEDFLFREYAVRERVRDILAPMVGANRSRSGARFLKCVLSTLSTDHPSICATYEELDRLFDSYTPLRNIVTHEGLMALCLVAEAPSQSKASTAFSEGDAREPLMRFAASTTGSIDRFTDLARRFVHLCRALSAMAA